MSLSTGPGSIMSMATGLLLVAMGLYIWLVAPRKRQNRALAAFTAAWGALVATNWLLTPDDRWYSVLVIVTTGLLSPVVAFSGLVLARDFGGREAPHVESKRLWWTVPFAFASAPIGIVLSVPQSRVDIPGWGDGVAARWLAGIMLGSWSIAVATMVFLLITAALRYPCLVRERPRAANSVLLLTFGLGTYLGVMYAVPPNLAMDPLGGLRALLGLVWTLLAYATPLVLAGLWLRNTARSPPPFAVRARWAAWTVLAAMLAAFVLSYVFGTWDEEGLAAVEAMGVLTSLTRFLAIATFSYAILRNQLLGIDLKLRWTLSRSTVAAVFVAVFFIASEGTQILFGGGNEWVGLFAAGALVFAIAPLQRVAERLAERAVPSGVDAVAVAGGGDGEQAYRRAVKWATRDAALTHDEERDLVVIATRLGITPERAFDIRNEVEMERRDPPHGGAPQ